MKKSIFIVVLIVSVFGKIWAQKPESWTDPGKSYRTALELFEREKFGAAQKLFDRVASETAGEMRVISDYYSAVCAYKMLSQDAGTRLTSFIRSHSTSPKINQARFYLGNYLFNTRSYNQALEMYTQTDAYELPPTDLAEFYFKAGYCRLSNGNREGARTYFYEVKDGQSPYAAQASYYYGHILYSEGKYENALREFNKLTGHEDYKAIIPFYITQIYYRQGKYEELLRVAPPLLENTSGSQKADIARMIGDACFRLEDYSRAYDYLLIHKQLSKKQPDRKQIGRASCRERV